ncbi:hypothetical protein Pelo_2898 [Pelomyxa schiedti]|nr:hypothetical protein Pelo_2898 [Pelomyxa schiedti]
MVVDDTSALPGATYTGRVVDGKPDGRGTAKYPNGDTYEGECLNGKADGWGVKHWADGGWYEGLYRDTQWKRGTWHDSNGVDVWDGEWVYNATANYHEMQGWGVQRSTTTKGGATVKMVVTVYEGEWDRDQWHGVGTWRSPDGSGDIYHGQFDHGKKCGTGSILFGGGGDGGNNNSNSNPEGGGGSYVGEWKDDVFHGRGVREAFESAKLLQSQLLILEPQFVLLKESLRKVNDSLQRATESNEELASHLKKLTELKGTLVMKLNESDSACKKLLGQTLTVHNSESEIQECARNISTLTKKVLWGIKSSATSATSEVETVPWNLRWLLEMEAESKDHMAGLAQAAAVDNPQVKLARLR